MPKEISGKHLKGKNEWKRIWFGWPRGNRLCIFHCWMIFWCKIFDTQFNTLYTLWYMLKSNLAWVGESLSRCDFASIIIKIKVPLMTNNHFNAFVFGCCRQPPLLYRADWCAKLLKKRIWTWNIVKNPSQFIGDYLSMWKIDFHLCTIIFNRIKPRCESLANGIFACNVMCMSLNFGWDFVWKSKIPCFCTIVEHSDFEISI